MFEYQYPRPALTADCLLFSHNASGAPTLLLIHRGGEPFAGHWALPGGFVNPNETSKAAAARELTEETGVTIEEDVLTLVGIFDKPGRDPRGWTVSAAYSTTVDGEPRAQGADDAAEARWMPIDQVKELMQSNGLAFDHRDIIADTLRLKGLSQ